MIKNVVRKKIEILSVHCMGAAAVSKTSHSVASKYLKLFANYESV